MKELTPVIIDDERLATTDQLAIMLDTTVKNIQKNLDRNRDKFKEGRDSVRLSHNEINELQDTPLRGAEQVIDYKGKKGKTFWTEKGLVRHAKILTNDVSWMVTDTVIEGFFDMKRGNQLPQVPQTYLEAMKAQVLLIERNELITLERDVAIKTKAEIGDKKVATAMNTASQAVKKVNKLEIELDKSKDFSPVVTMMQNNPEHGFEGLNANKVGVAMSSFCRKYGFKHKKINVHYTTFKVGTYCKEAWIARFGVSR